MAELPPLPPGFALDQPAAQAMPPLPDGFTIDQPAAASAAAVQQPPQAVAGSPMVGTAEAAMNIGSSMMAAPVAGAGGIVQGVKNMIPGMQGMSAADRVSQLQNAMTYQPRTAVGQAVSGAVTYPLRKLGEFADRAGDPIASAGDPNRPLQMRIPGLGPVTAKEYGDTGSPLMATAVNTAIQALPALLTRGRAAPAEAAAEVPKPVVPASPTQAALAAGKQLGLKFTPTQEGRTAGSVVEGLVGSAKLERSLSKDNAPVVNATAAKTIGLPEGTPVTRTTIEQARKPANRAYDEVGTLGQVATDDAFRAEITKVGDRSGNKSFPEDTSAAVQVLKGIYANKKGFDAADAVSKVRSLRSDAFQNIALRDPEKQALGRAQLDIAEALDNQLERQAQSMGRDDLVQRYRDARGQLSTIHIVRRALKGTNVSARALSAQQERGVKLPPDLKTIADSYDAADRALQDVGKIRDSGHFGVVDYLVGAGAVLHNPALAAAVLARPAVRAGLASDAYQRRGVRSQAPQNALNTGSRNALTRATAPAATSAQGQR